MGRAFFLLFIKKVAKKFGSLDFGFYLCCIIKKTNKNGQKGQKSIST